MLQETEEVLFIVAALKVPVGPVAVDEASLIKEIILQADESQ